MRFVNYEKDAIAANGIHKTLAISKNKKQRPESSDTLAVYNYDQNGNTLEENYYVFFGPSIDYEYDSLDFLTQKRYTTDFSARFVISYALIPDSFLLKQFWVGSDTDTCYFRFNKMG
ncbi:MAG: hypothetical protein R3E32_18325 [Chitinophagales bacterium]